MEILDADHTFLATLTVLYVEDDPGLRQGMATFIKRRVKRLVVAGDGVEGLASFRREHPDLLVTDIQMPNLGGLSLAAAVRAETPDLPVIVTTAFERTDYLLQAIELGVDRYVLKPVNVDQLEAALLYCAHILRLKHEADALRQAKADLLQAQHEATLGILAGGLAHDYNNLMQGVMMSVAMARLTLETPAHALACLDQAEAVWTQIKELGNTLGLLTQTRENDRQLGNLVPLLRSVLDRQFQRPALQLTYAIPEDLPQVRFVGRHLERVFEILARNAEEAMGGEGTVIVEAGVTNVALDGPLPLGPGEYLHLTLSDSGAGIDPQIYPVMFSPYTSTKERGTRRGMGMGLAVAQAIMKLHGGALAAEQPTEKGATLHLYLPVPAAEAPTCSNVS